MTNQSDVVIPPNPWQRGREANEMHGSERADSDQD